jgi:DNA-binding XRE family transcriptional regulator
MLEHTKEQTTTSYVDVKFRVPIEHLDEAKKNMASFGAKEIVESIPWEEVFPDYNASVALRGARHKESLTQKELAKLIEVSQHHISEMENGKRPIGKDMAKKLAKVLHISYRVFL